MSRVDERALLRSLAALLTLTALSLGLSYLALPPSFEMVVAIAIAIVKALIVLLFFMRLIEASSSIRLVVLTLPVFVLLFVGLVYGDVATRREPDLTSVGARALD